MPRWCLPTSCRPRLPNSWAHLPDETQGEAGTGIGHTAHLVAVGRSTVELRAFGVLAVPCAMCHVAVSGPAADKRRSVRDCQRATGGSVLLAASTCTAATCPSLAVGYSTVAWLNVGK